MRATIDDFWFQRWQSVCKQINDMKKVIDEPFKSLLGELVDFGTGQFTYFYHGFSKKTDETHQKLVVDYEYPPEYVLRVTLDQIAYDYNLIKQAWHQRCGNSDEKGTLVLADKWGEALLESVVGEESGKLLKSMPTIISYFHLAPRIRMIPYANVALVGVPLTTVIEGNRRDLLMMGHELAHFVYWNGRIHGRSVKEIMKEIVRGELPYIKNWSEEIFADVFGLAISNQRAVLISALDMIKDNAPSQYVQGDSIHPIDAVRVSIYLDTITFMRGDNFIDLEKTNDRNTTMNVNILQQENKAHRKSTGGYENFWTNDRFGKPANVTFDKARETLRRIIVEIGTEIIVPNFGSLDNWRKNMPASIGIEKVTGQNFGMEIKIVDELIARSRFSPQQPIVDSNITDDINEKIKNEIYKKIKSEMIKEFEDTLTCLKTNTSKQKKEDLNIERKTNSSFIKLRETYFDNHVESQYWKIVFTADGWTLKGPEVGPTGDWEDDGRRSPLYL